MICINYGKRGRRLGNVTIRTRALGLAALSGLAAAVASAPARAQSTATNLFGPGWGVRPWLGQSGVTLGLSEIDEVFGNPTGGIRRGADYDGVTELSLGLDLGRRLGVPGGTFNVSAFQIHGRSISQDNLDILDTASSVEANRATRLWELWYDQSFHDGQYDIKVGQQSLDQEFIISAGAGAFANAEFGWPALPSYDLYAGGASYPLASLGVRLRGNAGPFTALAGVFDDNPEGGPFDDDPQTLDPSGTLFSLNTGALFIAELQYALNAPSVGDTVTSQAPSPRGIGLAGLYKLGVWLDSGSFPDQRYDHSGGLRADPSSDGVPRMRRHNFSVYGIVDQTIWKPGPNGPRTLSVFARLMGAPGDRNLIDFAANLGLVLHDPLPGRDGDTLGLAGGFTKIGRNALRFDQDARSVAQQVPGGGAYSPLRSSESYLELTYQYAYTGWLTLQPDAQYIFTPGGGIADPIEPDRRVSNELVLGVRATLIF